MTPLVSILIPAYRAAPWIAATIESALAQTHPRVELIVVDDGSPDDTLARARVFAARGVRVVHQPNAGAAAARNHALRLAQGDFLQFLDADDLLSPAKIATQLALLDVHPSNTLALCRWGRFSTDVTQTVFADDDLARDFTPLDWMRLHCGAGRMMHPAAWLVPRALADQAGPWDERLTLNDDGEYFARVVLGSRGLVCAHAPAAETYYRSGLAGSLSRQRSVQALQSLHRTITLISSYVEAYDSAPATRRALGDYWRRLELELALEAPEIAAEAAARSTAFGGSCLNLQGGAAIRTLAAVLGPRPALHFQRLIYRLRSRL